MKYILTLLAILMLSEISVSQKARYDTTYHKGWLISYDSTIDYYKVRPIVQMEICRDTPLACSTVYKWNGRDGYTNITEWSFTYSSSSYEGDTIVKHNCIASEYGTFANFYYIPDKKRKKGIGEKYVLKNNEHYADEGDWEPKVLMISY